MALLSIIVPAYNKEIYIDACIQSILNQSFRDFELILINDGSTDTSGRKCDYYASIDKRVVVIHQDNKGVSAARNAGVNIAKGEYIGFVDCDDELEPDMYELLISTSKEYNSDITICGVRKIFSNKMESYYGSKTIKLYDKINGIKALLRKEFLRSVYDKIYKTQIAKNIKFEGRINEDIFFNFLAFNEATKVVFNDVLKYNYIIRDNSVSMSAFNNKYMDTIILSKKVVEICRERTPELIDDAEYFDLVTNISLLNLLLISGRKTHWNEYKKISDYLRSYSNKIPENLIRNKHKYALLIFKYSPFIYERLLKIYCRITDADVLNKNN